MNDGDSSSARALDIRVFMYLKIDVCVCVCLCETHTLSVTERDRERTSARANSLTLCYPSQKVISEREREPSSMQMMMVVVAGGVFATRVVFSLAYTLTRRRARLLWAMAPSNWAAHWHSIHASTLKYSTHTHTHTRIHTHCDAATLHLIQCYSHWAPLAFVCVCIGESIWLDCVRSCIGVVVVPGWLAGGAPTLLYTDLHAHAVRWGLPTAARHRALGGRHTQRTHTRTLTGMHASSYTHTCRDGAQTHIHFGMYARTHHTEQTDGGRCGTDGTTLGGSSILF